MIFLLPEGKVLPFLASCGRGGIQTLAPWFVATCSSLLSYKPHRVFTLPSLIIEMEEKEVSPIARVCVERQKKRTAEMRRIHQRFTSNQFNWYILDFPINHSNLVHFVCLDFCIQFIHPILTHNHSPLKKPIKKFLSFSHESLSFWSIGTLLTDIVFITSDPLWKFCSKP